MTNLNDYLFELQTTAWRTSGARFNAARRLELHDFFGTFSIAMFSAIGIGITVSQKIYTFPAGSIIDNYLTALSVFIGIFVIIISLIEWGSNSRTVGESLYKSAIELNQFHREVKQVIANGISNNLQYSNADVTSLREKYESIKSSCPFNHKPIDDLLFLVAYRTSKEFLDKDNKPTIGWAHARYIQLNGFILNSWYFGTFWLLLFFLLYMSFFNR